MKKYLRNYLFGIVVLSFFGCSPSRIDFYIKTVPTEKNYIASVAVIQENWDNFWVSSIAYRALITELMDVGFKVVEMENLDIILDEQRRQYSGLVDEDENDNDSKDTGFLNKTTISEIGKMLGVQYIVPIYVVPSGRKINMATLRLVSVETGEIVTSTTIATPTLGRDVDIVMKQVALDIGESFTKNEKIIRAKLYGVNNILKSDGDDAIENFKEEND